VSCGSTDPCAGQDRTPKFDPEGSPYCANGIQYQNYRDINDCSTTPADQRLDVRPTGNNSSCPPPANSCAFSITNLFSQNATCGQSITWNPGCSGSCDGVSYWVIAPGYDQQIYPPFTMTVPANAGQYDFQLTLKKAGCADVVSQNIKINVSCGPTDPCAGVQATLATEPIFGTGTPSVCEGTGTTFTSSCPSGQVRWKLYDAPGGSVIGYATQDQLPFGPEAAPGVYNYSVECVNTPCPGPAKLFTFTVNPKPSVPLYVVANAAGWVEGATSYTVEAGSTVGFGRGSYLDGNTHALPGHTLLWTGPNNTSHDGSLTDWFIANFQPIMAGRYTYTVTLPTGCSDSRSVDITVVPRQENYIGTIDDGNCQKVTGWLVDANHSEQTNQVTIKYFDNTGNEVSSNTVQTHMPRPDVRQIILNKDPNGFNIYGYDVPTPENLRQGVYTIHVYNPLGIELSNSPRMYRVVAPTLSATKLAVCSGESVQLTAGDCDGTVTWSTGAVGPTIITVTPVSTTRYDAICTTFPPTGGYCQSNGTSLTVTVNPKPIFGYAVTGSDGVARYTNSGDGSYTNSVTLCAGGELRINGVTLNDTRMGMLEQSFSSGNVLIGGQLQPQVRSQGNLPYFATFRTDSDIRFSPYATNDGKVGTIYQYYLPYLDVNTNGVYDAGDCLGDTLRLKYTILPAGVAVDPTFASGGASICEGQTTTFTSSCPSGQVQWKRYDAPNGNVLGVATLDQLAFNAGAPNYNPLPAGTYYYSVECVNTLCPGPAKTFTFTVNPALAASVTGNLSICPGQTTTLTAGTGTTYLWSTGATTATLSTSTAGTYSVTVSSGSGCSAVASATVVVNAQPTASITGNLSICAGQSTTLTANGGTTYLWSTGATTATLSTSAAGTYSVTVSNGVNCSAVSAPVSVTINPVVSASIAVSSLQICAGQSTTLSASGGTAYSWSTGQTTPSIVISPNSSTSYSVTATANGCSSAPATVTIAITQPPVPTISAASSSVCAGGSTVLTATDCPGWVVWVDNANPDVYLQVSQGAPYTFTAAPVTTTTYRAFCSVSACNSPLSTPLTVSVNALPTATITGNLSICTGQSTTLTAAGGTTYRWNTGATTATLSTTTAGTYSVTVSSGSGCSAVTSASVSVNAQPTATITGNLSICAGQSTTLTANGGTTYLWNTGATTAAISTSTASTYSVTASSGVGCQAITQATVVVSPSVTAPVVTSKTICSGTTATLSASGCAGTLNWSSGASGASFTTPQLTQTTTYTVTCTITGCGAATALATATVTSLAKPTVSANPLVYNAVPRSVTLSAAGCEGMTTQWTGPTGTLTGSTVIVTITSTQPQTFAARCISVSGCQSDTARVTIRFQTVAAPDITVSKNTLCGNEGVTLTAIGCETGATILWSNGMSGSPLSITPTATASYYAVCQQNGIDSDRSQTISVNVNPVPTLTTKTQAGAIIPVTGPISLPYAKTLWLKAEATNAPSFTWQGPTKTVNGAIYEQIGATPNMSGYYSVTATYAGGCQTTARVLVSVDGPPIQTGALDQTTVCAGGTLSVPFSTTGTFNPGNSFRVELSAPGGSFATSTTIGSGATSPIAASLPVSISAGSYQVRVVSSDPLTEGTPSATTLTVSAQPSVTATNSSPAGQTAVGGVLSLSITGQNLAGATYRWSGPDSFTSTAANPTLPTTTTASNGTYTVLVTTPGGCTATAQTSVSLTPVSSCSLAFDGPLSVSCVTAPGSGTTATTVGHLTVRLLNVPADGTPTVSLYQQTTAQTGSYVLSATATGATTSFTGLTDGSYRVEAVVITNGIACTATLDGQTSLTALVRCNTVPLNIRIKAVDATGTPATPTETDLLPRLNGGLGTLDLSVEELDGFDLTGYTYRWSEPTNTSAVATTATSTTLTGRRIGQYKVTLTNAAGDTLVAYTTLRAKPCRSVAHTYRCGGPATPIAQTGGPGLSSLAPGDTIRTGDFDVIVTEVQDGGGGIWTGVGYTEIPYLKGQRIAVEFKGASVNDCYEFTGQGTVQSAYDPSWGGITSADSIIDQATNFFSSLSQRFDAFQDKLTTINKLLENPTVNAVAIRDSLVAGQTELESLLAEATCMSDEDKNKLRQNYNQLKTIGGSSGGRLAATAGATDWAALGEKVSFGFKQAKTCTQDQIDIILAIIQFLRQNTEFNKARSHATTFKLSGATRCTQMFTEGFLNELLSQVDVLTLQEEIKKNLTENLRQVLQGEHRYQDLLECFSLKLAVTGDLSTFNTCSNALQLVFTDLLGGSTSLYNNIKSFANKVFDCECPGGNSSQISEADDCAYSRGRFTAFTLTVLAPGASKFAKAAKAFGKSVGKSGLIVTREALQEVASKIKNSQIDDAAKALLTGNLAWLDDLESLLGVGTKAKLTIFIGNGLDAGKLKQAFSRTTDKSLLLSKLIEAKSVYHQRVIVKDWNNIPKISYGDYADNGLKMAKSNPAWNSSSLNLPLEDARNFVNAIADELPAGTKLYRVTGGRSNGPYWTATKPESLGDVIGGTSVRPEWNSFGKMYEYTVPPSETLKVWRGITARQQITDGILSPFLPGGAEQVFVPKILLNEPKFVDGIKPIPLPW